MAGGGNTPAELTHTRAEAVAPWQQRDPAGNDAGLVPASLPGLAEATVTCHISWGTSVAGPCRNGIFQASPTIFWKDQPIFVVDGERPLRRWVEYKSLLSHCSKQNPTKSRSNYFLQPQEKALFCNLPPQEDIQDQVFPFSKPVAVYTFP